MKGAVRQALDVLQPRALARDVGVGSLLLLQLAGPALVKGVRAAARAAGTTNTAAPAEPAKDEQESKAKTKGKGKPSFVKSEAPGPSKESAADGDTEETEGPEAKKAPRVAKRSASDRAEQAGIIALTFAFGGIVLITAGGVVVQLVRPYMPIIAAVAVVAWLIAAVLLAHRPSPKNDQEKSGGEAPPEARSEAELQADWEARKAAFLKFAEDRVAAGAAGRLRAKGRGIPVDTLLYELQDLGSVPDWERKDMIAHLEKCGISVRPQMHFTVAGDKKTPPGVHVDDLAKVLGRPPRLTPPHVPDRTLGATPYTAPHPTLDNPLDNPPDSPRNEGPDGAQDEGSTGAPTVVLDVGGQGAA